MAIKVSNQTVIDNDRQIEGTNLRIVPDGTTDVKVEIDGSGTAAFEGKVTAATPDDSDAGNTVVTKDYVDGAISQVTVKDFGAVGDGVTDDGEAFQAAIDAVEAMSDPTDTSDKWNGKYAVLDLAGGNYKVGRSLYIRVGITIQNGSIVRADGATDGTIFTIRSQAQRGTLRNLTLDGGLQADGLTRNTERIIFMEGSRWNIEDCTMVHFKDIGLQLSATTQETMVDNCVIREWQFDEAGTPDGTLRTATGVLVQKNDNVFSNTIVAQTKIPLQVNGHANTFDSVHLYNGASNTTTDDLNLVLTSTQKYNIFNSCYFDNGLITLTDSYSAVFNGCLFFKSGNGTNTAIIKCINTTGVEQQASGLAITDSIYQGVEANEFLVFDGSFASDEFNTYVLDNVTSINKGPANDTFLKNSTGIAVSAKDGVHLGLTSNDDASVIKSNKSIILHADQNNTSGLNDSLIAFKHDGGGEGFRFKLDAMFPPSPNYGFVGSQTEPFFAVHADRIRPTPQSRPNDLNSVDEGEIIYNEDNDQLEYYNGSEWVSLGNDIDAYNVNYRERNVGERLDNIPVNKDFPTSQSFLQHLASNSKVGWIAPGVNEHNGTDYDSTGGMYTHADVHTIGINKYAQSVNNLMSLTSETSVEGAGATKDAKYTKVPLSVTVKAAGPQHGTAIRGDLANLSTDGDGNTAIYGRATSYDGAFWSAAIHGETRHKGGISIGISSENAGFTTEGTMIGVSSHMTTGGPGTHPEGGSAASPVNNSYAFKTSGAAAPGNAGRWSVGMLLDTNSIRPDNGIGIQFRSDMQFGIDLSQSSISSRALKLAADQTISLEESNAIYYGYTSANNAIEFKNGSNINLSIENDGDVYIRGDLTVQGKVTHSGSVSGSVAADGTVNGGEGFSVVKDATGKYIVTFDTAMQNAQYAISLCAADRNRICSFASRSSTKFNVFITDGQTGNNTDTAFTFTATQT